MPRLSVFYLRSALIHLFLGFTLGGLLLWNKGVPIHPQIWRLLPAHMEFLLLGWTVQLVIGVAYWILPRFRTQRKRAALVWLAFALLNGGVWLVVAGGFVGTVETGNVLQFLGRAMETGAVVAFAIHAWFRVKPAGF